MLNYRPLYFLLSVFVSAVAFASPQQLTYQGRIVSSSGKPLEYNDVSFLFEITSPDGLCTIYREQKSGINMASSGGVFDVSIGSGTKLFPTDPLKKLSDAFINGIVQDCAGGATWNASAESERLLKVQFHDGVGWKAVDQPNVIRAVPFSYFAYSAQKLGNLTSNDLLLKSTLPGVACGSGEVLSFNGTNFVCVADQGGAGVVSSVSASSPLTATGTTTISIGINVGTAAGTVAAGNDSRLTGAFQGATNLGGDLSGNLPNPVVAKIQGRSVSSTAPADGQLLKYNFGASQWQAVNFGVADLRSAIGTAQFASASCSSNQTLTWSSLTDTFSCSNISISESNISGTISAGKISGTISGNAAGFTGSLAGDVTGTQSATVVNKISGKAVNLTALADGQVLKWNQAANEFQGASDVSSGGTITSLTGDVTATGAGAVAATIADNAVTSAKIADLTIVNADISATANISDSKLATISTGKGGTGLTAIGTANQVLAVNPAGTALEYKTLTLNSGTVTNVSGTAPISVATGTNTPVISISQANATTNGYLSSTDWNVFNNKLSTALSSANIWVGNGSNIATPLALSGDATLNNSGVLSLKATGTAGTYTKITTDAQGRVTSGSSPTTLSGFGITDSVQNAGSTPSIQSGLDASKPAAATVGRIYVASDTKRIYRDTGSAWDLVGSAAVAGGVAAGDLSGTYPNPTVAKINGTALSIASLTSGQFLKYDGTNWTNSGVAASDLPASGATAGTYRSVTVDAKGRVTTGTNPTTLAGYGITDAVAQGGNSFGTAAIVGTNDAFNLLFETGGVTRATLDTSGNLGIGMTPAHKLDVSGNIRTSAEVISAVQNRIVGGNYSMLLRQDGSNFYLLPTNSGDQYGTWNSLRPFFSNMVNGDVTLAGGSLFARHGTGAVGIGTSNPQQSLHVMGNIRVDNGGNAAIYNSGNMFFSGVDGSNTHSTYVFRPGWGTGSNTLASILVQNATPAGAFNTCVQLASYGPSFINCGNVGIGIANPGYPFHVNGVVAGVGAYVNTSDERMKKNIRPIQEAREKLFSLRGVNFDWRQDEFPESRFEKGLDMGVIAQEVEKVFPEAVKTADDGFKSVAYSKLIAPLIEVSKETYGLCEMNSNQIKVLERKLASVESENQALKARLEKLESTQDKLLERLEKLEKSSVAP